MAMKRLTLTGVKTLTDKDGNALLGDNNKVKKQYTTIATIFIDPEKMEGFLPDGLDYVPTGDNIELKVFNPENRPQSNSE